MKAKDCKVMTTQLEHIIAIKLNKIEFYPKSLSEWLEVYFYSKDHTIMSISLQEMKVYDQPEDNEIWKSLYLNTDDKSLRDLAFKILPSEKGFNKKFISYKNSLTSLKEGVNTIISRASLLLNIKFLREMLRCYTTLEELMIILSSAREIKKRVNIFSDPDLKIEIHQIYSITVDEILKYIASCDCDLNNDFVSKNDDKKVGLLDLNHICIEFSKEYWGDGKEIFGFIENNLKRDFDGYIRLYLNNGLCDEISNIVFSRIESSNPTLEKLVEVYESIKNTNDGRLRDYILEEICKKFN